MRLFFLPLLFQIRVTRTHAAAPEVVGTFDLSFDNSREVYSSIYDIPRNASADEMKALLENIDGIDSVHVNHWGTCAG